MQNPYEFGNTIRDVLLQKQLDNECAADIKIIKSEDNTSVQIQLVNKKGVLIGHSGYIIVDPDGIREIIDIKLEDENQRLCITYAGETESAPKYRYCDLSAIYEKINNLENSKQDKLVGERKTGQNIKTINGENILGTGDIPFPATGVIKVTAGDGLTGGEITEEGIIAVDFNKVATKESVITKQDKLIAGENITIIDNVISSTGGGGGSVTPKYEELENAKLDDVIETGIYKIENAIDTPIRDHKAGLLDVTKLKDFKVKQQWFCNAGHAFRVMDENSIDENQFFVNGEEVPQGLVELTTGGIYRLSGNLIGNIVIKGTAKGPKECVTRVILDDINILSSELIAISFESKADTGSYNNVIELATGTNNYLKVVTNKIPAGEEDPGTLNAEDDLIITGLGYLTIENDACHAIRASKLKFNGEPHITVIDCTHDAIHGGKELSITGGNFRIINAGVDAFSHSGGSNKDGSMVILGGKFKIEGCGESAFQSKTNSGIAKIFGYVDIELADSISDCFHNVDVYNYKGVRIQTSRLIERKQLVDEYSSPVIKCGDQIILPDSNNKYILDKAEEDGGIYHAYGNFTDYIIEATEKKAKLILEGIYYNGTSNNYFVKYIPDGKNMAIDTLAGHFNYVSNKNTNCFESNKNLQFGGDGTLFTESENASAIYTPSGTTLLKSDGQTFICTSKIACVSNELCIGAEADKTSNVKGLVQFLNNELDAYLPTRYNSEMKIEAGRLLSTNYLAGGYVIGYVTDTGENPNGLDDLPGYCKAVFNYDGYANEPLVIIKDTPIIDLTNIQEYFVGPDYASDIIPTLTPSEGKGGWLVYNYLALENRIAALEGGGGGLNPQFDPTSGNVNLSGVEIDASGDINLGTKAILEDSGNVILK